MSTLAEHEARVERLIQSLRERAPSAGFASLRKGTVSHYVPDPHDPRHKDAKIDVSSLHHLLDLDVERRVCTAEPGLSFSALLGHTLPHNLAPALVPELTHITVGGAVAGCAVESQAFRNGGFHDHCLEYEMLGSGGERHRCSPSEDPELFEMIHGSYGTLGILTKLTFSLLPVKPFVHVRYETFRRYADLHAALVARAGDPEIAALDAIAHAPDRFVLCEGRFVDEAPYRSDYTGVNIYYRSTLTRAEDYLSTYDYFYRFDADCHWATRTIPGMQSAWGRRLWGPLFLGSRKLLRWSERLRPIERLKRSPPPVVTDVFIPERHAESFWDWYASKFSFYPVWLVPYRMPRPYAWLHPEHVARAGQSFYIDFAIYGLEDTHASPCYSEQIERKTFELGGIKTLIGRNHYEPATFARIYDQQRYAAVKQRLDPGNLFRTVYEKRCAPEGARVLATEPARGARRLAVPG
ncbi:MAG: FAD-binding oxidoreductase [Polyangiaceae bacterium]